MAVASRAALTRARQWLGMSGISLDAREVVPIGIVLATAFLLRVFFSQVLGLAGDLNSYVHWGASLPHQLTRFYSLHPDDNYPPLINLFYAVYDRIYVYSMRAVGVSHPSFDLYTSRRAAVFLRLPFVVSDLATTVVLYLLARRVATMRWALLCASLYAFSPGVILDGTLWAQSDGFQGLILLLGSLFALLRKPGLTGAMIGLGIVLKLFPILYAPLLLVFLYRTGGRRFVVWFAAAGTVTALTFCLPFMLPPHPQVFAMYADIRAGFGTMPWASVSAYNLWWMLNLERANPGAPLLSPFTIGQAGWLLFGVVVVLTLAGIWRKHSPEALFLAMGITALAYFDLSTGERERYVYPAIVFFLAAAFYYRWHLLLFLVTSIALFLDLGTTIIWNSSYTRPGVDVAPWYDFLIANLKLLVAISLVNMIALLCALLLFWQGVKGTREAADGNSLGTTPAPSTSAAQATPRRLAADS